MEVLGTPLNEVLQYPNAAVLLSSQKPLQSGDLLQCFLASPACSQLGL